jgi:ADP-ribosylglycohydrolase
MWVAAAVATALVADDWEDVALTAARVVPARSRLRAVLDASLAEVRAADDWLDAYERIHGRYAVYSHCRVVQEIGTLLSTLRFARGATDGIGLQVCTGNDTDSFGATAGSLLGALHGPAGFDADHWLGRFGDRIHLALATTHDASISSWGRRMAALHLTHSQA